MPATTRSLTEVVQVVSGSSPISLSYPHLKLVGCGFSAESGYWSFGGATCLPSGYTHPGSALGRLSNSFYVQPLVSSARIGQGIRYRYGCPYGYDTGVISIGDREISVSGEGVRGPDPVTSSVSEISLTCSDARRFFSNSLSEQGSGVVASTLLTPTITADPSVLTEGGFVSLVVDVKNFGSTSDVSRKLINEDGTPTLDADGNAQVEVARGNRAHCALYDRATGGRVRFVGTDISDPDSSFTLDADGSTTIERTIGGVSETIGTFIVDLNTRDTTQAVAVRDASYGVSCWYCNSWGADSCDQWVESRSLDAMVKVLPRSLTERFIVGTSAAPTFKQLFELFSFCASFC